MKNLKLWISILATAGLGAVACAQSLFDQYQLRAEGTGNARIASGGENIREIDANFERGGHFTMTVYGDRGATSINGTWNFSSLYNMQLHVEGAQRGGASGNGNAIFTIDRKLRSLSLNGSMAGGPLSINFRGGNFSNNRPYRPGNRFPQGSGAPYNETVQGHGGYSYFNGTLDANRAAVNLFTDHQFTIRMLSGRESLELQGTYTGNGDKVSLHVNAVNGRPANGNGTIFFEKGRQYVKSFTGSGQCGRDRFSYHMNT